MPLSVGDLVRVAKQPFDVRPRIKDEVGWIEELHENGTHAMFHGLKVDGSVSGCGTVMLDCLVPETAPHWVEAKRLHDENMARTLEMYSARTERLNARFQEIARKYVISVEEAKSIHEDIEKAIGRDGWPE